jgi:hypothetical protein
LKIKFGAKIAREGTRRRPRGLVTAQRAVTRAHTALIAVAALWYLKN